jgi:hypothetical protein
VAENEKLYSRKQVESAKRVISYSNAMGSMSNLIVQARSKRVDGMDFTTEDMCEHRDIWAQSRGSEKLNL